jgi:hypothetical protein
MPLGEEQEPVELSAEQLSFLLIGASLAQVADNRSKEFFAVTAQHRPQVAFAAASSFQRVSRVPGADQALGQTSVASEALVAITQAAGEGGEQLDEVEQAISSFVDAFGSDDASDSVKKKVFGVVAREPSSDRSNAAMEWGKSKQIRLQNKKAQDPMPAPTFTPLGPDWARRQLGYLA